MRRRPDVTLTQLRYFVKAATYSSMTKAADELHIAQSAVSAAVSQLEQQIGTQLFIRHRARGLALTAAGEEMLRDTLALLAHLDEVLDGASGRVDQVRGTVRLACFITLTPFVLPRLLSDLGVRHPDLEIEVIETSAAEVRTVLRNGTAELAITYDLALGAGIETEFLGDAAPYVVLPPGHRLANRKSIRLTDLADEPMVLLDLPDSRDYFESMLAKRYAGWSPAGTGSRSSTRCLRTAKPTTEERWPRSRSATISRVCRWCSPVWRRCVRLRGRVPSPLPHIPSSPIKTARAEARPLWDRLASRGFPR